MKRGLSFLFALFCFLSLFVIPSQPRAFAETGSDTIHLTDLAGLDETSVFTLEQLLSLLQEAYALGYQEGQAAASSFSGTRSVPDTASLLTDSDSEPNYVLNTNTGKFHYPDCSSVSDMNSKNRRDFYGTREEAVAMGYVPCKRCNP